MIIDNSIMMGSSSVEYVIVRTCGRDSKLSLLHAEQEITVGKRIFSREKHCKIYLSNVQVRV